MRKNSLIVKKIVTGLVCVCMVISAVACTNSGGGASSSSASSLSSGGSSDSGALEGKAGKAVNQYSGYLGYGYNTVASSLYTEEDIDASRDILDMDAMANKGLVYEVGMSQVGTSYFYADEFEDIFASIGKAKGVSGGVEFEGLLGAMGIAESKIKEYESYNSSVIMLASGVVKTKKEYISTTNAETLAGYATEDFKNFISKNSGEDILNTYGSTILTEITLGGRMDVIMMLNDSGEYTYKDIVNASEYALAASGFTPETGDINLGEAGLTVETATKIYDYFESNSEKYAGILGGTTGNISIKDVNATIKSFATWKDTVASKPALVDASKGIPIWDVIKYISESKAQEVKAAFDAKQKAFEKKLD